MNKDTIYKIQCKTSEVLAETGVAGSYPVQLEKIASSLGYECIYFTPSSETKNISGAVNHTLKKIYINPQEHPKRQLFTLAHEIGHIVLHKGKCDHIDFRSTMITSPEETEANLFAANLLMPIDVFTFLWKEENRDIYKLSDFFGVSTAAIGVRAESLNLD